MRDALASVGILGIAVALYVLGMWAERTSARQREPMACEPKCEFVYRNKKLINVTCPDSLGRMP